MAKSSSKASSNQQKKQKKTAINLDIEARVMVVFNVIGFYNISNLFLQTCMNELKHIRRLDGRVDRRLL